MHISWIFEKYLLWTGAGKWWKAEGQTQLFKYREKCKGRMIAAGREREIFACAYIASITDISKCFCKINKYICTAAFWHKELLFVWLNWGSERLKTSVRKTFVSVLVFTVNGNYKLNTCLELCSIQTIILFSILQSS